MKQHRIRWGLGLILMTGGFNATLGQAQPGLPNLGPFEFYAITPSSSTMKPGKTITLRVQYCPPESRKTPASDDDLVPLPNLNDDLVPLPNLCKDGPKVKPNSVTATAGTVTMVNATTLKYTAPPKTPKSNPVTITATYLNANGTKAKVLLVAKVNVMEAVQVYKGSIHIEQKLANSSQTVSGEITWTLQQSMMGIKTYQPSGTLTVQATSDKCTGSGSYPIKLGQMVVDRLSDTGQLVTNSYLFEGAVAAEVKLTCPKGGTASEAVADITSCLDQRYADITHLSGSCKDKFQTVRWDFKAVK